METFVRVCAALTLGSGTVVIVPEPPARLAGTSCAHEDEREHPLICYPDRRSSECTLILMDLILMDLERRDGRVVEGTALEMRHTRKGIGGSNPSLSAISKTGLAKIGSAAGFLGAKWSYGFRSRASV